MNWNRILPKTMFAALLAVLAFTASLYAGDGKSDTAPKKDTAASVSVVPASYGDSMRVQGEQRFHANCGRCHAAPHKFPPRMMATVVRHMRVRATITDEDMRFILFYMTQ